MMWRKLAIVTCLGGFLVAAAGAALAYRASLPRRMAVSDAEKCIRSGRKELVTLRARIEPGPRLYSTSTSDFRTERPSLTSLPLPREGYTLIGPSAVPKQQWPEL